MLRKRKNEIYKGSNSRRIFLSYLLSVTLLLISNGIVYSQFSDSLNKNSNPDIKVFRAINNIDSHFLDILTGFTNNSVLPLSVTVPSGFIVLGRINKHFYDENSGVLLLLSEATSASATFLLKSIVKRDRPYISLKNVNIRDWSTTGSYSLPSGHTSVAFSMATSLTLRYPDKPLLITGLYIYAAAVGFGRVYSGVHYPTDILAGIATGVGSSVLIYSLRKQIVDLKNNIVNEKGREDRNSSITSESLLLFSLLLTDYINTLFSGNNSKLISNSQLKINFTGNSSYTQYSLFF